MATYPTPLPALSRPTTARNKLPDILLTYNIRVTILFEIKTVDISIDMYCMLCSLCLTEMEYCASAASMLAEEIWQIAEEFVEVLRKYVGSI